MGIAAETIRVAQESIQDAIEAARGIETESIREAALKALDAASVAIGIATAKTAIITVDDDGVTVKDPDGESRWYAPHMLGNLKGLWPFATVVDNRTPVAPRPTKIELHLNSAPLTRSERSAIKEVGGEYTACRGHSNTRFVTIPLVGEGRRLADRLVANHATHKRTVAVFRHYVDRDGKRVIHGTARERVIYIPNGTNFSDFVATRLQATSAAT
jgi:hypothetical protein